MRVPYSDVVSHHHIRDARGLRGELSYWLDDRTGVLVVERVHHGRQLRDGLRHPNHAALVGIADLLLLHPDCDRPGNQHNNQHNQQLQEEQL